MLIPFNFRVRWQNTKSLPQFHNIIFVGLDADVGGDVRCFSPNMLPLGSGIKKCANADPVASGTLKQQTPGFSRIAFGLKPPSHYAPDH